MVHSNLRFKPIRWINQFPLGEDGGPEPFSIDIGPLSKYGGELYWHMQDLCQFHQIIYKDINRRSVLLDEQEAIHKIKWGEYPPNLDEDDLLWFQVQNIRSLDSLLACEQEITRIKRFVDQYTVIGLSAALEKFLFNFITCIEYYFPTISIEDNLSIFKWEDFERKFKLKGIKFKDLDGYADTNECRTLNNAIKHSEIVDNRLARFSYFESYKGVNLKKLDFEMQRYLNGVSNFLGHVMDSGNRLIGYSMTF